MDMDYKETVEAITKLLDDSGVMVDYPLLTRIRFLCGEDMTKCRMTKRRLAILMYIKSYIDDTGAVPLWADVARHFKVTDAYIAKEMGILRYMGYVRWERYAPASLKVVRLPDRAA